MLLPQISMLAITFVTYKRDSFTKWTVAIDSYHLAASQHPLHHSTLGDYPVVGKRTATGKWMAAGII